MPIPTTIRGLKALVAASLKIFHREPWWAEFWSASAAIGYGLYSIYDPYDPLDKRGMYQLFKLAAPEFWKWLAVGLGIIQVMVLCTNNRWCRWGVCVLVCWWWLVLANGVHHDDPHARLTVFLSVMGAINLFSVLRLLKKYP